MAHIFINVQFAVVLVCKRHTEKWTTGNIFNEVKKKNHKHRARIGQKINKQNKKGDEVNVNVSVNVNATKGKRRSLLVFTYGRVPKYWIFTVYIGLNMEYWIYATQNAYAHSHTHECFSEGTMLNERTQMHILRFTAARQPFEK